MDYTLTAAVSLMAGTQALSSLLPALLPYETPIALVLLVLVGWANLRGVKEAGRSRLCICGDGGAAGALWPAEPGV